MAKIEHRVNRNTVREELKRVFQRLDPANLQTAWCIATDTGGARATLGAATLRELVEVFESHAGCIIGGKFCIVRKAEGVAIYRGPRHERVLHDSDDRPVDWSDMVAQKIVAEIRAMLSPPVTPARPSAS